MKKILALLIACFAIFPTFAQTEFVAQVTVDSAFARRLPHADAAPAASLFQNDSVIAVGRNLDGAWLQVRRPIGTTPLGWMSRAVLSFTFEIGLLPITDFETGLEGTEPVVDTGFAVLTLGEIAVRPQPDGLAPRLATTEPLLTLPVIDRTPDAQWLRVNYRGIVGWLPQYLISTSQDLEQVPIHPAYSAAFIELPLIPPEIQLAQIDRLVAYVQPLYDTAAQVAAFWSQLESGATVRCDPITGDFAYYNATPDDIRELPELRRELPSLRLAVDSLNDSVALMQRCGIYLDREISSGYADAINARGIFGAVLTRMEYTREAILAVQPAGSVSP